MSHTAMTCYRCLDSLSQNIWGGGCARPLVGTNSYVRDGKALSSCADASDLPREDEVDLQHNMNVLFNWSQYTDLNTTVGKTTCVFLRIKSLNA